jgi:hypothetical protein
MSWSSSHAEADERERKQATREQGCIRGESFSPPNRCRSAHAAIERPRVR